MQQYEVLSTIAAALYGRVDRCRHRESGEIVAVKRMELSFAGRKCAKDTNRAVQEDVFAELSTNLKVQALGGHPFVLPMKDCFMEQQVVQLVLAHCARGELLGVINTNRAALSTAHLLRYFKQVLLAMEFLHANGIAHRDVSLENVLVDERDCCQVCDFGLATSTATMKASPVGKMHYMAPEALATGDNSNAWYNPIAADVWSLGVMLFSMLAGRYPFREPQRRDDQFRLLEDFGIAYLLEKLDVDTQSNPAVADLLVQFFVVDPAKRPSVATILQHSALADIDCENVSTFVDSTSTSINSCCCGNQCEHEDNTPVESVAVVSQMSNQMPTCQMTPTVMPLQPESSSPAPSTKKSSSSRAIITPQVATIHPTMKASKELEVLQAELPVSRPRVTSSSSSSSRRELISRTIHKIFRKKRDSDVAQ